MYKKRTLALIGALLLSAGVVSAQDDGETIAVPLSDPSRPMSLEVSMIHGGITVEGYDGSEVLVVARSREKDDEPERRDGMMRIPAAGYGLTMEERNNAVTISADWSRRPVDLEIRVPRRASLELSTVNGGAIEVSGVSGVHELSNTNGPVSALEVSGSVVANTTNGEITVTFVEMDADTPMSFTTWNGDVDVTLPASLSADLKLEAGQGDVYSDFDVTLKPVSTRVQRERDGGSFRVRLERAVFGTVGGGGPDFHFKTFNGSIYLRKAG